MWVLDLTNIVEFGDDKMGRDKTGEGVSGRNTATSTKATNTENGNKVSEGKGDREQGQQGTEVHVETRKRYLPGKKGKKEEKGDFETVFYGGNVAQNVGNQTRETS